MTGRILSRLGALNGRWSGSGSRSGSGHGGPGLRVQHDRERLRFTVSLGSEAGNTQECAVLRYKFTNLKRVDLMSTHVPEAFRGRGVAALLSKAAMDFVVEEHLQACVSCWYVQKFIQDHPALGYDHHVVTDLQC
ncbi:Protein NATD1 [Merluccius polli]|uniref:Protein NATD1 n=1 Tax=Merluccius polli TaxID=89951 RepID=A0AA47N8T5_MERPO|nr:Protein NATD1 [Merluccius polli]